MRSMTQRSWLSLVLVAVCATAGHACAATAYKCIGADGALGFQDHPCAAGARQQQVQLSDDVPPPPVEDAPDIADPVVDARPAPAPPDPPPRIPAPSFFLCTRYDGSTYLSETGIPNRVAVPYGVLSDLDSSLADAYGGRNGIGVSAPGLRTPPSIPASRAPFAGAYVWVDDRCHHAAPREACTYLRAQLDDVRSKLLHAFSDTEAQLQQQESDLRERLHGC
jgi:hypothetical protein